MASSSSQPPSAESQEEKQGGVQAEGLALDLAYQNAKPTTAAEAIQQAELSKLLDRLAKMNGESGSGDRKENHKFWKTQPVPDFDDKDDPTLSGPIEPDKKPDEIRATPYALPAGFEWTDVDLKDEAQLTELYELLSFNYVEDNDAMFRFDYSADFLRWALMSPGWLKQWHTGVRATQSRKLVAFISAIPADLRIYEHVQHLVEINFLCAHKKLRAKRFAPVLIKEITRRVHLTGCFQAVYTAGINIPRPVSICNYYHRSLNPKKLIETGFSHLGRSKSLALTVKLYKLPEAPQLPGLRALRPDDIPSVHQQLAIYLQQFAYAPVLSEAECRHWLLPRKDVVYSYVVENPETHEITDFVSFYNLPSSVLNNPHHTEIRAAYQFYYFNNGHKLTDVMRDALIMACKANFDVFNCLNLMKNDEFLEKLLFGIGDGKLHYYLYNWRCSTATAQQTGLILL